MSKNPEGGQASESGMFGLAKLALLSLLTGAAIGLVIGCFQSGITHALSLFCGYGRSHIDGQLANL